MESATRVQIMDKADGVHFMLLEKGRKSSILPTAMGK